MTVYRVLVRHGLITPQPRRRQRSDYKRWQREAPMALWQLDIVGGLLLADGTECKLVTGVDDHSRFCVIASVVQRATGRAVCLAFAQALRRYGIPDEVLTDNGKQFTARFGRGGEVLFDRICRDNAITHRLTTPRGRTSPSTWTTRPTASPLVNRLGPSRSSCCRCGCRRPHRSDSVTAVTGQFRRRRRGARAARGRHRHGGGRRVSCAEP